MADQLTDPSSKVADVSTRVHAFTCHCWPFPALLNNEVMYARVALPVERFAIDTNGLRLWRPMLKCPSSIISCVTCITSQSPSSGKHLVIWRHSVAVLRSQDPNAAVVPHATRSSLRRGLDCVKKRPVILFHSCAGLNIRLELKVVKLNSVSRSRPFMLKTPFSGMNGDPG